MSKLQRDILLACIAIIVLFSFIGLVFFLKEVNFNSSPFLTLSLIILVTLGIIFVCHLFWMRTSAVKVLLLGTHSLDKESIINQYETQLLDGHIHTQIIPQVILDQDSSRTRAQLRRLRGSFFYPPRVVISLNINQLLLNNEAQQTLLTYNLNRVLHLLKRSGDEHRVDVIINTMTSVDGFYEFSNLINKPMRFKTIPNLKEQFTELQNSSQALLEYPSETFLNYLKFAHNMPLFLTTIDTLLTNLILTGFDSNSEVFFSKH
jgi:hypothetical protein